MLRRCLYAISNLAHSEGAEFSIIIDNEPEPNNRAIVEEFGAHYEHDLRRGIAHAHNAAATAALALSADWLAFTDDGREPAETWLCDMLEAQRDSDAVGVRFF